MTQDEGDRKDSEAAEPSFSLEEGRAKLGTLALRAGYGSERFILVDGRRNEEVAAIIGMKDLQRLRDLDRTAA